MESIFTKDNPLNILFVGRLEKEKGTDILFECIKKTLIHATHAESVNWHIVGSGSEKKNFDKLVSRFEGKVHLHGQLKSEELFVLMRDIHLTFMPSTFLETFGLVALESLSHGVPVCGFKKGGLSPFIGDGLELEKEQPIDSFLHIFDRIMTSGFPPIPDLSLYDLTLWREELKLIVANAQKILLVHDYMRPLGGAELYIHLLKDELQLLGKEVEIIAYGGYVRKLERAILGFLAPYSFWHQSWVHHEIEKFNPDIIWMHTIGRYIGLYGVKEILSSGKRTIMTHHDLGLIVARPSGLTEESDIPEKLDKENFLLGALSPMERMARSFKFRYLQKLWGYLKEVDLHLVPSEFMKAPIQNFGGQQVETFGHSIR